MAIEAEVAAASEAVSEATEAEAEAAINRTMVLQQQSKVSTLDPHEHSKILTFGTEMGTFLHATEGELVCNSINSKIPYFNAPIYLENKTSIGKVDEILGPINQVYFTIKPQEGIQATSFKQGDKFFIGGDKLLPLDKFLPKPKPPPGAPKVKKPRGGGARGGRGAPMRGGRGAPRGRGGSSFGGRGGSRGGFGGSSRGPGGFSSRGRGAPRGRGRGY